MKAVSLVRGLVLCLTIAALAGGLAAPSAAADFGISALDGEVTADASHTPFTQAGGHPYEASVTFQVNTETNQFGSTLPSGGNLREADVDLPPGFIGSATAVPECTTFFENIQVPSCSPSTQVGVVELDYWGEELSTFRVPLFLIDSAPGVAATLAFSVVAVPVVLRAKLDTDDQPHIAVVASNVSQGLAVLGTKVTIWGTPADPVHDDERGYFNGSPQSCANLKRLEIPLPCAHSSDAAAVPMLTNPTACTPAGVGLRTDLFARSWPGGTDSASFLSHDPPGFPLPPEEWGSEQGPTDCNGVPFEPTVEVTTTNHEADSPTGLVAEISIPSDGLENPSGTAQSDLKRAEVILPEGMTANPSSAGGQGSCSRQQLALETPDSGPGEGCPLDSKIGTVEVETPLLDEMLSGSVFLAAPNDNQFNSLLALYIVVKSERRGVVLKLPGKVSADPATGRLATVFDDNPQLPFARLRLELKSGPRAPLINPPCGSYTADAELTPWARPDEAVHASSAFDVTRGPGGGPCPAAGQFDPRFEAGTVTLLAGAYSPLVVNASRPDGSQSLSGLSLDLPEGLVAKLAGTPYCPEAALAAAAARSGGAEAASASCPAASQVGVLDVGAGAGSTPFHVQGKAYLAGPYKGAPLSIAVITPAVAGPFDLGTVVVRAKADVDPVTTQIHVTSDPIPQILQGIPLKIRSVAVDTDKPEFTLNPTDCDPMSLGATLFGTSASKALSSRFQVGACKALDFKPKLTLKLKGGTRRGENPALRATLTMPKGQANIAKVSVALPHSEFLDQSHIKTVCTRVQFAADSCPPGSVYGKARAFSPLLDRPLEGPVYLRSSSNPLPDLVVALEGQIEVDLSGRIDSVNGGIRNTFNLVPDAPVSKFVLEMKGGRKGLLVNSRNLCKSVNRASVKMDAQSGKVHDFRPVLGAACG